MMDVEVSAGGSGPPAGHIAPAGSDQGGDGPLFSCIRQADGIELHVGDDVFFERSNDGIPEAGVIVDMCREGEVVYAICRYKDRAWAAPCYDEKKDVEKLMLMDQLLSRSRTKRNARPVTRYQPQAIKPQPRPRSGISEEERKRRKQRKLRREKRKRREERRRKKELAAKLLSTGTLNFDSLSEEEQQEAILLTRKNEAAAVVEALMQSDESEPENSDDMSSDGDTSSSSFPESSGDEWDSDGEHSDVSTDSCPSEPDYTYWRRVRDPSKEAMKTVGLERYGVCPKCDSSDSGESDEEELEMGLTSSVVSWTYKERWELLKEYMARERSARRRSEVGAMTYKEWCLALRLISEDVGGLDHLESCSAIKGVKRCEGMRTMYGAIRAPLIQEMVRFAGVTKDDVFIDIGSGLGTVVLHMAAVTGCKATGIELETSRFTISALLNEELIKLMGDMELEDEFVHNLKNRIDMINDDVRLHEQKILNSTAIYFNNHGVWFDETASKQGEISVEHWVAKLFAKTAIGTRLIILKSIPHLKGDWFKEEVYVARSNWLTWAREDKPLFCYTKLKNTWMCEKCSHENPIVRDDQDIWEMRCENNCPSRAQTLRHKHE